jgi:hypothetical protein
MSSARAVVLARAPPCFANLSALGCTLFPGVLKEKEGGPKAALFLAEVRL